MCVDGMRRLTRIDRLINTTENSLLIGLIEVKRGIRAILQGSCAVSVARTVLWKKQGKRTHSGQEYKVLLQLD